MTDGVVLRLPRRDYQRWRLLLLATPELQKRHVLQRRFGATCGHVSGSGPILPRLTTSMQPREGSAIPVLSNRRDRGTLRLSKLKV